MIAVKRLAENLLLGRREALAKAITLIESRNSQHQQQANELLQILALSRTHSYNQAQTQSQSFRIGVAGPPGAGKSSFIEALGLKFLNQETSNNKVAVIPVDPSSHISGGSILGDKTRMEQLSRNMNAYIRASPTRGVLGGIAEHTSDVISLCEYADYNIVVVESVGLGQSEVDIDGAVDILLLVVPPTAGDALQASKKGIMEAADMVIVNKADGELMNAAKHTKADYAGALHFVRSKHLSWQPKVLLMSAHTGYNLDLVYQEIMNFKNVMLENGKLYRKRHEQAKKWATSQFQRQLLFRIQDDLHLNGNIDRINHQLEQGHINARLAAKMLLDSIQCSVRQIS